MITCQNCGQPIQQEFRGDDDETGHWVHVDSHRPTCRMPVATPLRAAPQYDYTDEAPKTQVKLIDDTKAEMSADQRSRMQRLLEEGFEKQ